MMHPSARRWIFAAIVVFFISCGGEQAPRQPEVESPGEESPPAEESVPQQPDLAEPTPPDETKPLTQQQLEELALNQPRQEASAPVPPDGSTQAPPQGPSETPQPLAGEAPPQPSEPAPSQSFLRGKEFLLQYRSPVDYPPPHDFKIGQLEGRNPVRSDDPKVLKLFTGFLARLSRGEIAQALIANAWREAVTRPLREVILQGWPPAVEWRLGRIFWENDRLVRAPFILRTEKRWAAGLIYGEPAGNDYLVTDVVVDLMDLKKDREQTSFEPDSYPLLRPLP